LRAPHERDRQPGNFAVQGLGRRHRFRRRRRQRRLDVCAFGRSRKRDNSQFRRNETISGTETGSFIESGGSQRVLAPGKAIGTTVDSSGTLTVLSGGTASAAIVNNGGNMLVAKGGVVAGVTINTGAVVSNAGIVKANSALSAVIGGVVTNANTIEALGSGAVVKILGSITDTGTVLASGNGAHVELDGAVISGGKLQTLAGGEIDVNFGVLSDATIASGSIVDINNNGTLALSGRIANSGLISALGSPSVATLAISGAVVLSGGGKVSLSPSGDNQIIAAAGGGILSNVNNTIAGAGHIGGGGLTVVNSGTINANTASAPLQIFATTINAGKLEATASGGALLLNANISNTGTGTILASGSGAHVVLILGP
jgi:autotransporter passenger strand-loop-strand repeat protein